MLNVVFIIILSIFAKKSNWVKNEELEAPTEIIVNMSSVEIFHLFDLLLPN